MIMGIGYDSVSGTGQQFWGVGGGLAGGAVHTLFLNCLWIASSASLIVTPLRFRATTSSPNGKCRSIFLTGGSVSIFFRMSLSSTVDGEVLTFLSAENASQCPRPYPTGSHRRWRA